MGKSVKLLRLCSLWGNGEATTLVGGFGELWGDVITYGGCDELWGYADHLKAIIGVPGCGGECGVVVGNVGLTWQQTVGRVA